MRYNINITIPLAPVAQKRPRFLRSSFRVYDPSAKDKKPFIKFFQENILDIDFEKLPSDNIFINEKLPSHTLFISDNIPCHDNNINFTKYESKFINFLIENDSQNQNNNEIEIHSQNDLFSFNSFFPILNPVKMDIIFNFARPKSHYLKAGNISDRFKNNYPLLDIDNIIKFLLDVMQPQKSNKNYIGLIQDDKQVLNISACKKYLNNRDLKPFINLTLYN